MKIIKKLTAIALAACMALSFTGTAQTVENEEDTFKIGNFIATDTISDIESKADENGLVHWSDVLGYDLDTVKKELAENPPAMFTSEQDDGLVTVTKNELIEMDLWDPILESPKKYTPEETRFIIERLEEVKEPEDEITFDHRDIYLDTR